MRNFSDTSCGENQNTHFMFNNFFFRKSCRLWHNVANMVEPEMPQMTKLCGADKMRYACRITKAIQTHTYNSQYVLLFHYNNGYASTPQCCVIRTLPVLLNSDSPTDSANTSNKMHNTGHNSVNAEYPYLGKTNKNKNSASKTHHYKTAIVQKYNYKLCNAPQHRASDTKWINRKQQVTNKHSQIFGHSRSHLKILDARRVTRIKFHYWKPKNIRCHCTKVSRPGYFAPGICAPLILGFRLVGRDEAMRFPTFRRNESASSSRVQGPWKPNSSKRPEPLTQRRSFTP
jgi:hypothetical protein